MNMQRTNGKISIHRRLDKVLKGKPLEDQHRILDAAVELYKCADTVPMDHYVAVVSRRSEVEARISEKKRGKQPGLTEGIMGGGLVVAKSLKHIPGV